MNSERKALPLKDFVFATFVAFLGMVMLPAAALADSWSISFSTQSHSRHPRVGVTYHSSVHPARIACHPRPYRPAYRPYSRSIRYSYWHPWDRFVRRAPDKHRHHDVHRERSPKRRIEERRYDRSRRPDRSAVVSRSRSRRHR